MDLSKLSKSARASLDVFAGGESPQSYADSWSASLVGRVAKLLDAGRSPEAAAESLVGVMNHAYGQAKGGNHPGRPELFKAVVASAVAAVVRAQERALKQLEQAEADELAMAEAARKAKVRAAVARSLAGGA